MDTENLPRPYVFESKNVEDTRRQRIIRHRQRKAQRQREKETMAALALRLATQFPDLSPKEARQKARHIVRYSNPERRR